MIWSWIILNEILLMKGLFSVFKIQIRIFSWVWKKRYEKVKIGLFVCFFISFQTSLSFKKMNHFCWKCNCYDIYLFAHLSLLRTDHYQIDRNISPLSFRLSLSKFICMREREIVLVWEYVWMTERDIVCVCVYVRVWMCVCVCVCVCVCRKRRRWWIMKGVEGEMRWEFVIICV